MRWLSMVLLLLLSSAAFAAEEFYLEEIKVTAEKRSEDAQKVSVPMNVFTESRIEDRNIRTITDISQYVPNLFATEDPQLGETTAAFRGLAPNDFDGTNALVLVVDGVTIDAHKIFSANMQDVERIEVLRGPQGTLYGKNAAAGVVKIVTRKPGNQYRGRVYAGMEENKTYRLGASVDGPIKKDVAYFGLSASYSDSEGWLKDNTPDGRDFVNDKREQDFSLRFRLTPSRKSDISFIYSHHQLDAGNPGVTYNEDKVSFSTVTNVKDYYNRGYTDQAVLKMDFDFKQFNLTSITSYLNDDRKAKSFMKPPTVHLYSDQIMTQVSQELRVSSPESSKWDWVAGAYAELNKEDWKGMGFISDFSMMGMGLVEMDFPIKRDSKSTALFGEVKIPLYKDSLSVTLGSRYEHLEKGLNHIGKTMSYPSGMLFAPENRYDVDASWDIFLGKIALNYQHEDNLLFYTTVAQGYIPGGYSWVADSKENGKYNETHSLNYEVGFKSTLFDKRLNFNGNVFLVKYKDLQAEQEVATGVFKITNAGKAHAKGIEFDINARPAAGWDIFATAGYLDTEYDEFVEDNSRTKTSNDYGGNKIVNAPELTFSIGTKYRHSSGFMGLVEYKHTGKTYFSKDNADRLTRDAYGIANAKIGYESEKGIDVYAYVKNALDEKYYSSIRDADEGMFAVGRPRAFGFEVNYRF